MQGTHNDRHLSAYSAYARPRSAGHNFYLPRAYSPVSFQQRYPTPSPSSSPASSLLEEDFQDLLPDPPRASLPSRPRRETSQDRFADPHSSNMGPSTQAIGSQFIHSTIHPPTVSGIPSATIRVAGHPDPSRPITFELHPSNNGLDYFNQPTRQDQMHPDTWPQTQAARSYHPYSRGHLEDGDGADPTTTKSNSDDTSLTYLNSIMGSITLRPPKSVTLRMAMANAPINSTISRDNTAGEHARQAELFAHFGTKVRNRAAGTSGFNSPHQAPSQATDSVSAPRLQPPAMMLPFEIAEDEFHSMQTAALNSFPSQLVWSSPDSDSDIDSNLMSMNHPSTSTITKVPPQNPPPMFLRDPNTGAFIKVPEQAMPRSLRMPQQSPYRAQLVMHEPLPTDHWPVVPGELRQTWSKPPSAFVVSSEHKISALPYTPVDVFPTQRS